MPQAIVTRARTWKAFRTWKDLILPYGRDTRIRVALSEFDKTGSPHEASPFALAERHPDKLPSRLYIVNDLPSKIEDHLRHLLDEHYAKQATRTRFTNENGRHITPNSIWSQLNDNYNIYTFSPYSDSGIYALFVSRVVQHIYYALTRKHVEMRSQQHAERSVVITESVYRLDGESKILWEDKTAKVFDKVIGDLIDEAKTHGSVKTPYLPRPTNPPSSTKRSSTKKSSTKESTKNCTKRRSATFESYNALLRKICYHARSTQPSIRWALVFSGLKYMMIYIPRSPRRPVLFCSPVMDVCHTPNDQPAPAEPSPLPIWSFLVYMLLTEDLGICDDVLDQRFCLPEPLKDAPSEFANDPNAHSGKLEEAPESMLVLPYGALPISLLLVDALELEDDNKPSPFIILDRYCGGDWFTVYASSRSHIIIKLAVSPKKDQAELKRLLKKEKEAYDKLSPLTGWAIPRCHGEYLWHGGRALVFSNEGQSLDDLKMDFASLGLTERLILFVQIYLIHYFGVCHRDLVEQNVVRKGWCRLKVIDFAFSDVEHTCPGWKKCSELKSVWRELQLDKLLSFLRA